jgi:hypothetical protein
MGIFSDGDNFSLPPVFPLALCALFYNPKLLKDLRLFYKPNCAPHYPTVFRKAA